MTNKNLPDYCYNVLEETGEIIIVKNGEKGFFKTKICVFSKEEAREIADEYNGHLGVSRAQAAALTFGSMFGYDSPGADPDVYDESGILKKERLS